MKDIYESTTARVIAQLEQGVAPWVRPWSGEADPFPSNLASGHRYKGVNVLILGMESHAQGYTSNQWLTFRQALELGGHVRKGEKATQVVFFQMRVVEEDALTPVTAEDSPRSYPVLKTFAVFNRDQVDGLPEPSLSVPATDRVFNPIEEAEEILAYSGAEIRHQGFRAYYAPTADRIYVPLKQAFTNEGAYYSTLLHELTHWTGHPSRLHRELVNRFGEARYAMEELIAELGSAYLSAHCRIDGQLQHASYISSWLDVLHRDKKALFIAASKAQQASDYLLRTTGQTEEEIAPKAA